MDGWRAEDYAFVGELDRSGWAWQFLRRCPDYRADYAWFIATWRALEGDYGTPPQRDFFRWKQDPRAWRPETGIAGCGNDVCPGENDQVLIECWMGAKWGLRKFPIDPAVACPEELAWREQVISLAPLAAGDIAALPAESTALAFDLALPLAVQWEAAQRTLIARRHSLARAGVLPPLTLRQGIPIWQNWLRILDALEAGASLAEIAQQLKLHEPASAADRARAMSAGGYRRILMLTD